jgi:hypothetical protein
LNPTDKTSEALELYRLPLFELIHRAHCTHRRYHDVADIQKCFLLSIKTGGCPEDCGYCSQSAHVFNYPTNNASLEVTHVWKVGCTVHTHVGVTERYQQSPYAVWDISMARKLGRFHPYVRLTNIANTGYQEVLTCRCLGVRSWPVWKSWWGITHVDP